MTATARSSARRAPRAVYVAIALSGFTALSAQVLWTRLLSLLFGATVYTFSLILGGVPARPRHRQQRSARRSRAAARNPRVGARLVSDAALRRAGVGGVHADARRCRTGRSTRRISTDPWFNFQLDIVRCLWVVLPGAILWGASFPLALAAVAGPGQDPGRLVGGVYAANTVGAIVGAVVTGLMLVVWIGTPARRAGAHRRLGGLRR